MIKHSDKKVRRKARRAELRARKSRSKNVLDNRGGYMLVDRDTGFPVAGFKYDLSPSEAIEYCTK